MGFRLVPGDAAELLRAIAPASLDAIITSPPYNVGKAYADDPTADRLPWPDYYAALSAVLAAASATLRPGGLLALVVPFTIRWQRDHPYAATWADYDPSVTTHRDGATVRGRGRIEPLGLELWQRMAAPGLDLRLREPIVWVKGREHPLASHGRTGSDADPYLRPTFDMLLIATKSQWHHRGATGRRGTDVVPLDESTKDTWVIPPSPNRAHPAPFPAEIPRRLLRLFVHAPDAVVCDPYCGSGTVGAAALERGLAFIGGDQSLTYLALAQERLETIEREMERAGDAFDA